MSDWRRQLGVVIVGLCAVASGAIGQVPPARASTSVSIAGPFAYGQACQEVHGESVLRCEELESAHAGSLQIGGAVAEQPENAVVVGASREHTGAVRAETGTMFVLPVAGTVTTTADLSNLALSHAEFCLQLLSAGARVAQTCTQDATTRQLTLTGTTPNRRYLLVASLIADAARNEHAPVPYSGRATVLDFTYSAGPSISLVAPTSEPLPNLSPTILGTSVGDADPGTGIRSLRIMAGLYNIGGHPLDLIGGLSRGPGRNVALECVAWVGRGCIERSDVGDFVYDSAQREWQYEASIAFELRRLAGGVPDMSSAGLVTERRTASLCLGESISGLTYYRDPAFHAGYSPRDPLPGGPQIAPECDLRRQGLSPGWLGYYDPRDPGLQIPIDSVAPGTYAVVEMINPDNHLRESNLADNVTWTVVNVT